MTRAVLWSSLALLLYTHAGYPALLWLLLRFRRDQDVEAPTGTHAEPPSVSLIVAAHDEEGVIAARVANARALDYPDDRLEVVVASDGSTDRTAERARAAGAGDTVEIVGFVGDRQTVASYYRGADVFCSTALHEVGVANVYLEAMASGCPVVASSTGGAPEAVVDGETGLLVEPGDAGAIAGAVGTLLRNPEHARELGAEGRSRRRAEFSIDRTVRTLERLYLDLLGRG